ncbi:hypothetical protein J529_3049 [Acinetobacter baumannii 99063]|uniref:Uncharacterized protein n=1 Tax=Acinetobacter baumannii 99063 TaxID=1310630 RepID=A0A009T0I5_ACIBA|nr:hypothetical protein J529_3049 [Acinetobacter baumannii 99063]
MIERKQRVFCLNLCLEETNKLMHLCKLSPLFFQLNLTVFF